MPGSISLAKEVVELGRRYLDVAQAVGSRSNGAPSAPATLEAMRKALPPAYDASLSEVLIYRYEESPVSVEYFLPFAWRLAVQQSRDMGWAMERLEALLHTKLAELTAAATTKTYTQTPDTTADAASGNGDASMPSAAEQV